MRHPRKVSRYLATDSSAFMNHKFQSRDNKSSPFILHILCCPQVSQQATQVLCFISLMSVRRLIVSHFLI